MSAEWVEVVEKSALAGSSTFGREGEKGTGPSQEWVFAADF